MLFCEFYEILKNTFFYKTPTGEMPLLLFKYLFLLKKSRILSNRSTVLDMAGKNRFTGAKKSVLLKASSGDFVHLVTLRGTRVRLIVYIVVHQMKYVRVPI